MAWMRAHPEKKREYDKASARRRRTKIRETTALWRQKNREKINKQCAAYRENLRRAVMAGYGSRCACCGESDFRFLTLDHVNGDGAQHRRKSRFCMSAYTEAKKENYPSRFQLLCFNCNCAKGTAGMCPHMADRIAAKGAA